MHVAIVEDDPVIAKAVVTAVREAGHECTWVPDGESAVRQNVLLSNDVVILDLMLPKMSGLEVLKAARDAGVRTPVILLTALGTVADKLAGFQSTNSSPASRPSTADLRTSRRWRSRRGRSC
jgi:DNA-binding response OmpR family regulator